MINEIGRAMRNVGNQFQGMDDYIAREAAKRVMARKPQIADERKSTRAARTNEIQGRSQNEKVDMGMAMQAEAQRQQGDLSPGAEPNYQMSPVNLGAMGKALGIKGAGSRKGNFAAPNLSEAEMLKLVQSMPGGGRAFAEAAVRGEGDAMSVRNLQLQQQLDENLADPGTKGKLSRGAMYAGIAGGITASGAALIDLMKYLSQGQQVDAERENVLPS